MINGKRFQFTLEPEGVELLEDLKRRGKYKSLGEVLGESLGIRATMQDLESKGFIQILMRNPKTRDVMLIRLPHHRTRCFGT